MHAGVAGRMHVGLNQELHSVAAIGVVVRLGVAWSPECGAPSLSPVKILALK